MRHFLIHSLFLFSLTAWAGLAYAQDEIPRQTVLVTCEGDPLEVTSSQSSFGAPIVDIGILCADAISIVLSTPFEGDNAENKDWNVDVTFGEKKITNYLFSETLRIVGPQGPPGPKGDMGDPGTGGSRAVLVRPRIAVILRTSDPDRRIILQAPNVAPGRYAAHILINFFLFEPQNAEGQLICRVNGPSGELEITSNISSNRGIMEFGSEEYFRAVINFDPGSSIFNVEGPFIVSSTVVSCELEVDGGGTAVVFPVGTFVPVSVFEEAVSF